MGMSADEVIRNLPKALISWYDFEETPEVLFVSGGNEACEVLFEVFEERGISAVKATEDELSRGNSMQGSFDIIIGAGILERSEDPERMLSRMRDMLKSGGKLLIGAENRLALRYFCGDKDAFSGHVMDGIDGYLYVSEPRRKVMKGRAYSKAEYEKMLSRAGFGNCKFYSVFPCLTRPQMLIAEDYLPNEPLDVRVFPQYNSPETIYLEEESLYASLMENKLFHPMANAFLMECSVDGEASDIDQITVQGDRGHEEAMATIIRKGKSVSKRALYPEGRHKAAVLMEHAEYLKRHQVPMVAGVLEKDTFVMPYINGEIVTDYFKALLRSDRQMFQREFEKFREIILGSSEHVPYEEVVWEQFEPGWEKRKKDDPNIDRWRKLAFGSGEDRQNIGVILKRGYIDMVSLNCFHDSKGFRFFDQEFFIENCPANAILIRTINFIYRGSPELGKIWPYDELLKTYNLYEYRNTWWAVGSLFLQKLRNDKELAGYHRLHRRDSRTIVSNRHRMDYPQEEYERLFQNIFKGVGSKKVYLFGSGNYAKQFIEQFGKYYQIAGILDNNESRWGEELLGIKICSPAVLTGLEEPFKVFICIKFFEEVLLQLKAMHVSDISVYDSRLDYERPIMLTASAEDSSPKEYHIGYVAGVFDLFHIGHLNILRRAKEHCDYLIVGVVSDEQVIKTKKTKPIIPFDERIEILRACRYVDEAVEIPVDKPNTEDAYYMYHFDVQFSGSDYANDPAWLARKVFLQQHGSDMVFFPYTQTTSSTEIKDQIGGRV